MLKEIVPQQHQVLCLAQIMLDQHKLQAYASQDTMYQVMAYVNNVYHLV